MALDINDVMALKGLEKDGNSSFENYMVAHKEGKRANGVGITGLVLGSVGLLTGVTAWIFGGMQAKKAQEVATAQNNGTSALLGQMANLLAEERRERVNGDINLTTTINDTVSGQQSGTIANQIENSATAQVLAGLMTGEYQASPKRVSLWQEGPCNCPASGCGCGN